MPDVHAACAPLTAVILAGGGGRRMGGADKGLTGLAGRPMIAHVIDALRPQVDTLLISANRNRDRYAAFGWPVIADDSAHAGPLAGIAAALQLCTGGYLLSVPCDSPFIPAELGDRLCRALERERTDVSVASDGRRLQPMFAVLRKRLLPALLAYLAAGQRKVETFYTAQSLSRVDCADWPRAFLNINTPEQRAAAERLLSAEAVAAARRRPQR